MLPFEIAGASHGTFRCPLPSHAIVSAVCVPMALT